jgi:hypothetical protein
MYREFYCIFPHIGSSSFSLIDNKSDNPVCDETAHVDAKATNGDDNNN